MNEMINSIRDNNRQTNEVKGLKTNKNRRSMINLNSKLLEFMASYLGDETDSGEADYKADDKADNKADNEQPDTTDTPELESEESAEQRRKQKGHRLKILTPQQMLGRLPISLAQLKAGNNSEKFKVK